MDGVQKTKGMQHSDAMHQSHHGNQVKETIPEAKVDSFQKSEQSKQLITYNEKGQIN